MKIIIVRHGDPNYILDTLTKSGRKEAVLLSERPDILNADYYYCSPLGRAKKTASYTMKKVSKKLNILPWLKEFEVTGSNPYWDQMPDEWTLVEQNYTLDFLNTEKAEKAELKKHYSKVCKSLDELLEKHGYVHSGKLFNAVRPNHDTIVLFCHFGLECVLLSHIIGISPMILWHNFVALPTGVTTLVTEERKQGVAVFRIQTFSDLSHLYKGGAEPSFAARFCECFSDNTRH